jgi:hypothetical protein
MEGKRQAVPLMLQSRELDSREKGVACEEQPAVVLLQGDACVPWGMPRQRDEFHLGR